MGDDGREVRELLAEPLKRLANACVTISVVGQVKSGKSSLINALTGLGDFLPTEVNPWTAVITNLLFGHPDQPESGAVFELFSEDEWTRMIEGNSEVRQMAEQLLPGFRSDILEQQIQEMQKSARQRLGSLYKLLLGKKHRFNDITPEVLERYVSAGYGDDARPDSSAGQYSGITKSASVFFPAGPFRVPTTVSDTPGINDPFLVRDEITTSSFRAADIFVVTLSAHQALGVADIALLKMLEKHSAKKTVIFINRIDELENPEIAMLDIVATLDERLRRQLDRSDYLLLTGSAHWGDVALTGSDSEVAAAVAGASFRTLLETRPDLATRPPREQLYFASGVPLLAQELSRLITDGRMREALAEGVTECDTVLQLFSQILSDRLRTERTTLVDTDDIPRVIETEKRRINDRIATLTTLGNELTGLIDEGQNEILRNGDVAFISITNVIDSTVKAFVHKQIQQLREALEITEGQQSWSIDLHTLCERLDTQVAQGYRAGRQEIDRILTRHALMLNARIQTIASELDVTQLVENLPFNEILPGFKPRSSLVEMDFTAKRGWRFWRSKTMTPDEAIERLSVIVLSEMRPMTEEVVKTVRAAVAQRNQAAMERLRDLAKGANSLLQAEIQTLRDDATALSRSNTRDHIAQIYEERNRRAERIETGVRALKDIRARLRHEFGDVMAKAGQERPPDRVLTESAS
ncbi:MAG: dynamin family protein [Novosphingobium sp.]|nr:dynamin family protein [Novosphingobium sp.]